MPLANELLALGIVSLIRRRVLEFIVFGGLLHTQRLGDLKHVRRGAKLPWPRAGRRRQGRSYRVVLSCSVCHTYTSCASPYPRAFPSSRLRTVAAALQPPHPRLADVPSCSSYSQRRDHVIAFRQIALGRLTKDYWRNQTFQAPRSLAPRKLLNLDADHLALLQ